MKMLIQLILLRTSQNTMHGMLLLRGVDAVVIGQPQAAYQGIKAHWRLQLSRAPVGDFGAPGS